MPVPLPQGAAGIAEWLAGQWCETVVEVLEAMTGERPAVERAAVKAEGAAAGGTEAEEFLWWEQGWSLGPQALLVVGAPRAAWHELGAKSLVAAGIDDPEPADIRSTYCELLSQGSGSLARRVTDALGREVTASGGVERPSAAVVTQMFAVRLSFSGAGGGEAGKPAELRLGFSAAYLAALQEAAAPPEAAPVAAASNMDLLLDVELPVTVSFGRTQLQMRDVLKLTTGSIVELNRAVNEMVEVVVNNCVVARGEVVVVEGNYGVRVQQIVSRQQRLQTLQ